MIMFQKSAILLLSLTILMLAFGCTDTSKPASLDTAPIPQVNQTQTMNDNQIINETPITKETQVIPQSTNPEPESPAATVPDTTSSGITLSELSTHNAKEDCWISYKGEVYDITSFLPRHPGGVNSIARYCGTASEFEKAFTKQHGTGKVSNLKKQLYKGTLEG